MKILLFLLICGFAFSEPSREIILLGHNSDVDLAAVEDVWESDGEITYLTVAETMDIVSTDTKDTDFAIGILTLAANITNNKTITIGSKVYTFQTTLTDIDGNVLIGALATNSIDNLIAAITLTGTPGTDYALLMTEHPNVTAAAGAGDTMDATSEIGNNEAVTTETDDNASWGDITLINGVGLRSIRVEGLDNNYIEISEIVELNGTTDVTTTLAFLRVNKLNGQRVGSENDNAGKITATATSARTIQDVIGIADGISHNLQYTVPANKIAHIKQIEISATDGVAIVLMSVHTREPGQSWHNIFNKNIDTAIETLFSTNISNKLSAKTDFVIKANTDVNDTEVFARCSLLLLDK